VPFPIGYADDGGLLLEYIGGDVQAAPRLAQARLSKPDLVNAWAQLRENVRIVAETGYVHADLSAYNALWWKGELWLIDFPQAVDLVQSPHGFEFLHRDALNVGTWFSSKGVDADGEALFAELVAVASTAPR
jgi:RIO kinase 1